MSDSNVVELSKPFLTGKEIQCLAQRTMRTSDQVRSYRLKKRDTMHFLIRVIKRLQLPIKILQNASYLYQRFFLFTDNFPRYLSMHYEVGITALFVSLKMNDCIKKLLLVIQEANLVRGIHLSPQDLEEQRGMVLETEKAMMECESFDFRNYCIEDLLIKFTKLYKIPQQESYFCWSVLNDLYLTDLTLQFPPQHCAVIALRTAVLVLNGVKKEKTNYNIDTRRVNLNPSDPNVVQGINIMLEFYIDNFQQSFLADAFADAGIPVTPKEAGSDVINVKIDFGRKYQDGPAYSQRLPKDGEDLFFSPRDPAIVKNGCIRFLYNRERYLEEGRL